jgi:hypothetical protein
MRLNLPLYRARGTIPHHLRYLCANLSLQRILLLFWATLQQLSEKAHNLSSCCSGVWLLVTESSLSSSDIDPAIALIKAFRPVYEQESPQRLHKLFSSRSTQVRYLAIEHVIHTSLVSSIRLESNHIQLLSPPLAWFFRHCNTSHTESCAFHLT